jgi:protein ImuB
LYPVEVVAAGGRQLSFGAGGGDAVIAAEQAGRAAARVQSLVGVDGVLLPEWRGGRGPGERVALVDAGGATLTEPRPAARRGWIGEPWPGTVPDPAPAIVHPASTTATSLPRAASTTSPSVVRLLDENGYPVRVSGRGVLSADPAAMADREHGRPLPIVRWAGPWPCDERWWDPAGHRRRARLQVITTTGAAHLLVLESGRWTLEATYD